MTIKTLIKSVTQLVSVKVVMCHVEWYTGTNGPFWNISKAWNWIDSS